MAFRNEISVEFGCDFQLVKVCLRYLIASKNVNVEHLYSAVLMSTVCHTNERPGIEPRLTANGADALLTGPLRHIWIIFLLLTKCFNTECLAE